MSVSSTSWLARVLGVSAADRSATLRAGQAFALIVGALVVWFLSLPSIRWHDIGQFGLVGVLPWTFFVALGVLIAGFCATLNERRPSVLLLALYTVALNVMLRGTVPLVYDEPRYAWVYKHIGVTNYIRENAAVNPLIDAYHNWPGFFALSALFTDAAGFASPVQFAPWAQLFFGLLYLLPLLLILRSFSQDRRVMWSGVWIFSLANWVGQEYFAPQAFAFFLFLVILAVVLTTLRRTGRFGHSARAQVAGGEPLANVAVVEGDPASRRWRAVGVTLLVLALFSAIAPSHQLTPFMLIAGLAGLALFGQVRVVTLPIWILGVTLLWNFTMATAYLSGHDDWYNGLGKFTQNLSTSLRTAAPASEAVADPGRSLNLLINQAFTLLFWGLAFLGGLRRLSWGYRDWAPALLALAPFPLLAAQSYGGEMLLRVFLFSSPFMAFFVAALIFPDERVRAGRTTTLLSVTLGAVFAAGFLFSHFANEIYNRISPQEVQAARYLYGALPPNSLLVFTSHSNFPEKIAGNYDQFGSITLLDDYRLQTDGGRASNFDANDFARFLRERVAEDDRRGAYVVFTTGQKHFVEFLRELPPGAIDTVERKLRASGEFKRVYDNGDARVYALVRAGGAQGGAR